MPLNDIQKHNPWDKYGLFMLRSRLDYIRVNDPKIYRIYNEKGELEREIGEYIYLDEIDEARKKGLKVELQDNSKLIRELETNIKELKERIEESGD